jgi:hypothetical protein
VRQPLQNPLTPNALQRAQQLHAEGGGTAPDLAQLDSPARKQDPSQTRGLTARELVVAAPALIVALLLSLRSSQRAELVWAGMLAYSAYSYAFYVFGVTFNDLFLLHGDPRPVQQCVTAEAAGEEPSIDQARLERLFSPSPEATN